MSISQDASRASRSPLISDPRFFQSAFSRRKGIGHGRLATASTCIAAVEFAIVACTAYLASFVYNEIILLRLPPSDQYVPAALFIATVILLTSLSFRQFIAIPSQTQRLFICGGLGAVGLSFSLFLSAMFVFKVTGVYSRGTFLVQFVAVAFAVAMFRAGALSWVRYAIAHGYLEGSRVVLIGEEGNYASVLTGLADQGVNVACRFGFPLRDSRKHTGNSKTDLDMVRRIIAECRSILPDDILIVPPDNDLNKAAQVANLLAELPASIHLFPQLSIHFLQTVRLSGIGTQPTLQVVSRPLSFFDRVVKRAFDLTAAAFGLVVFSPMLLLVCIAIKLDSRGPVFFRQTRHGFNNEPIGVLKFRSMTVTKDGNGFQQAKKSDPRVTRVGQILRRTNLDELPQLFNVLVGEMSIVGPRPHPVALNEQFKQRLAPLMRRHKIKPGITGWAQVNGCRGETRTLEKMQQRLEYDLYYIDNWSFLFDMQIILLTLFSRKAYSNAY
jgi:Undecaprenyl-phosphate glucose phosphotransferase